MGGVIDDPVVRWVAGQPGAIVWERSGAAAVACPDLSRRDRVAVEGEPEAVSRLLRDEVFPRVGPTYRPIGDEELIVAVTERLPGVEVAGRFGWMDVAAPVPAGKIDARWLQPGELPQVAALLGEVFPHSYAQPGDPGVRRWAGVRGDDGTLLAVAADAWSTADIGLLSGVATRVEARGRGLARELCAFVTNDLITGRDRVGLFVDSWNVAAITAYTKLGFVLRKVAAASVS